jgi:4-hydroxythreonine-4-phosphate dehydrogenase
LETALRKDFNIIKPRIAVLGLNPHAGESGKIGKEELEIIGPAISAAKNAGVLAFGPYSADGFFGSGQCFQFDAVLAMYHDQGLTGFKAITQDEGVNYTAGLTVVRTSPGHGTAFDLAPKGTANEVGLRNAIYFAIDVVKNREEYRIRTQNPLPITAGTKEMQ